jgi:hypothetical protein
MDFGVHLPLIAFNNEYFSGDGLVEYTRTAAQLGFKSISANDHLVFSRPWLDGLTTLAAISSYAGSMTLFTTVTLPVARKKMGMKLGRPKGVGKSKLDAYRPEIDALLANGSTHKFIASRYGTTEANFSRWMKKHNLTPIGSMDRGGDHGK